MTDASLQLAGQFGEFLLVGALTTTLDFLVYNLLARRPPGWSRVAASLVSCTVAMAFSFSVNWRFVFHPAGGQWLGRAGRFLLVTAASSYLIQSTVIYGFSRHWMGPVRWVTSRMMRPALARRLDPDTIARNIVKAAAVGVGLVWNFAWYRGWVYA